jgi:hypothetical protein
MNVRHALVSVLVLAASVASADTLRIPRRDPPPNTPEGVLRPVRGMTMEAVVARFGEPRQRLPAVGEPPIARWVYDRYTVYFEYDRTLHAVVVEEK